MTASENQIVDLNSFDRKGGLGRFYDGGIDGYG